MSKLITFEEAIRKGLIKEGDEINPNVGFRYNNEKVELTETGYYYPQKFKREELKWFYVNYKGKPILFGSRTNFMLYLQGKDGYNNVHKVLNTINSLYSNEKYGFYAKPINFEVEEYLRESDMEHKLFNGEGKKHIGHIGCETFVATVYEDGSNHMLMVNDSYVLPDTFFNSCYKNEEIYTSFNVYPVICVIKSKLLIDVNSKERDGVWKMVLPKANDENLITLEEAIRNGLIKDGDYINPIECYPKEKTSVIIKASERGEMDIEGGDKIEEVKREKLEWFFILNSKKMPLLIGKTTNYSLRVVNGPGYRDRQTLIEKVLSMYSNGEVGFIARSIVEDDIICIRANPTLDKLFRTNRGKAYVEDVELPLALKKDSWVYITSTVNDTCPHKSECSYNRCNVRDINNCNGICINYGRAAVMFSSIAGICPVIQLNTETILVDINSKSRDGEWKLIPAI